MRSLLRRGHLKANPPPPLQTAGVIDGFEFVFGQVCRFESSDIIENLLGATGADQGSGNDGVAKHPGERHLREALPTGVGDLVEGFDLGKILLHAIGV